MPPSDQAVIRGYTAYRLNGGAKKADAFTLRELLDIRDYIPGEWDHLCPHWLQNKLIALRKGKHLTEDRIFAAAT